MLDRVRLRVDERDGIGADRHHRERVVIRRKPHAVHKHLAAIQRTEVGGRRISEANYTDQVVVRGIDH
jgi:hypothetical protein